MRTTLFHFGVMLTLFQCTVFQCSVSSAQQSQSFDIGNQKVTVELIEHDETATFTLHGLGKLRQLHEQLRNTEPRELSKYFAITVVSNFSGSPETASPETIKSNALPPLSGEYELTDDGLQFTTRYPLNPRVRYAVELFAPLISQGADTKRLLFTPKSQPENATASVVAIYPTSDLLPENLLKFYIHFSGSMSRGEAYNRIHLMHGNTEVKDPFLELGEELWDQDQKRFTLFIHPGRIKRGVKPREDDGLPMTEGNEYRLVIDADWLDADRKPLSKAFEKKFKIVAADDQQPSPERWKIETPKAGTTAAVMLTFNESMDHAMLQRVLTVRDVKGMVVDGQIEITKRETEWSFKPIKQWKRGTYSIEIATNLEDLCGNSIARPFETALQTDAESVEAPRYIAVEFSVND